MDTSCIYTFELECCRINYYICFKLFIICLSEFQEYVYNIHYNSGSGVIAESTYGASTHLHTSTVTYFSTNKFTSHPHHNFTLSLMC